MSSVLGIPKVPSIPGVTATSVVHCTWLGRAGRSRGVIHGEDRRTGMRTEGVSRWNKIHLKGLQES